jgi:hypothetical protein
MDECLASRLGLAIPRNGSSVRIVQEAVWVSELVWTQRLEEKYFACPEERIPFVQSVVIHYTE